MRVCSPQLGISPQSILGGEIYDREILKHLALLGVSIEIILPIGKPHDRMVNWNTNFVPVPTVVPPHLYNLLVLPYLFSIYQKRPFDILRIHSPTFLGLAAKIFKKYHPKVPVVGVYHWVGEGGTLEALFHNQLMNTFDAIITDSKYTESVLKLKSSLTPRIYPIYNGVDKSLRVLNRINRNSTLAKGYQGSACTLLFMGLFIKRKNPGLLLKVMESLVKNENVKLILCGIGPEEKLIRYEISEKKLTANVHIIPPVFGEDKNKLLNSVDIFVHPSFNEGFSLAVIEAMACGLPVVITEGFSAAEAITHGINGFLCKNSNDWINYLRLLIKNKKSRQKIKINNLNKVKLNYNWKIAAKKHLNLFNKLILEKINE